MKKQKIFKRFASMIMAVVVTIAGLTMSAGAATASDFTDVKPTDWYYEAVDYATDKGLFNGTSPTTFSPNAAVTRGMFVTVLGRLSNVDVSQYLNCRFTDVKAGEYFAPYIEWAATFGIVDGITPTTFEPMTTMTREQMATILYRYATAADNNTLFSDSVFNGFPDSSSVSAYAQDAMKWATSNSVINGMDNKLNPRGTATRAQIAKVFLGAQTVLVNTTVTKPYVKPETPEEPETPAGEVGFVFDGKQLVYRGDGSNFFREAQKITADEDHFYYNGITYDYTKPHSFENCTTRFYRNDFFYEDGDYLNKTGYLHGIGNAPKITTLSNGQPATEKNVTALLKSLEAKYPKGTESPECSTAAHILIGEVYNGLDNRYVISSYNYAHNVNHHEGVVTDTLEELKPGDVIFYSGPTTGGHAVVVVRKIYMRNDDGSVGFRGVEIAEGNYGGKWNWGRQISQADVESGKIKVFSITRYVY